MSFYQEIKNLYIRVKHGAISSDDFAFEVGVLLTKYAAQQSEQDDGDHSDPRLWVSNNSKRRK